MSHRQKLERLAHILVSKHNAAAKDVARARLQQSFDIDDYASAHLWTDVAEKLSHICKVRRGNHNKIGRRTGWIDRPSSRRSFVTGQAEPSKGRCHILIAGAWRMENGNSSQSLSIAKQRKAQAQQRKKAAIAEANFNRMIAGSEFLNQRRRTLAQALIDRIGPSKRRARKAEIENGWAIR
jgi:hypothetical protein